MKVYRKITPSSVVMHMARLISPMALSVGDARPFGLICEAARDAVLPMA